MKYIRTKDGRIIKLIAYKLVLETPTLLKFEYIPNGGILFVQKDNIIKQADTIEELCDEYIVDFYGKYSVVDIEIAKYMNSLHKPCYGAIWVKDKQGTPTLKPVAEFDEKGELELL